MTLENIIKGCKNNDQRCYTKLYNIYKPKLLLVIKKYFKDIDTVNEVLQETFIKVYQKINNYSDTGSFENWLIIIAKNTSIDYFRKYKYNLELDDNNIHLIFNPEYEKQLEDDIDVNLNLIKESINQLTPAYKKVFNLYVMQDYKHNEISEILGISEGSSKSNFFRAKNKIKEKLNGKLQLN